MDPQRSKPDQLQGFILFSLVLQVLKGQTQASFCLF